MRRAAKIDSNQNQIVKDLRKLGFSVAVTSSLGNGFPDLVVAGWRRTAKAYKPIVNEVKTVLVELKDGSKPPSQRKLTPDEIKFIDGWKGQVIVATDLEGILKLF